MAVEDRGGRLRISPRCNTYNAAETVMDAFDHAQELEVTVESEAKRRGLGTTVRMLLLERVEELDDFERMNRAEEWQRAEAWTTWERMKAGDVSEGSRSEIDAEFDNALQAARIVAR